MAEGLVTGVLRTRGPRASHQVGTEAARAASCLTRMPAFFRARGSPSSPVPMFPFRRWIRVWYHLRDGRRRDHAGAEARTQSAQTQPSGLSGGQTLLHEAGANMHEAQTLSTKPSWNGRSWEGLEVKTAVF